MISIFLAVMFFIAIVALIYLKMALPNDPLRDITVNQSADRVAKGKYLATNVMVCMDCHSKRDWTKFSGPLVVGTLGKGGEVFDQSQGLPGRYVSRNITPYNLARWSDAELFKAITSGVTKSGKALFPVMPYHNFGTMDEEDIKDVIAYLRVIEPIDFVPEESHSDFPMNFIINTIPQEPVFSKKPSKEVSIPYGRYLANAAGCAECHTPFSKGALVTEKAFSGGRQFSLPDGQLNSPNINPDPETGIGKWTQNEFVAYFKAFDLTNGYVPPTIKPGDFNTIMPWTMYAGMDETDLAAIYVYLSSLEPFNNRVKVFLAQD